MKGSPDIRQLGGQHQQEVAPAFSKGDLPAATPHQHQMRILTMTHLQTLLLSGVMALGALTAQSGAVFADVNNIVLVHGLNMDGGAWRAVYDRLTADDYYVTVVQLPMTSIADDIAATRRALDAQDGPVVLVGHSYGGMVISQAGVDPDVKALVYIAAF
jgi:pimeloyl-ACP methyl ester carboxylesterase